MIRSTMLAATFASALLATGVATAQDAAPKGQQRRDAAPAAATSGDAAPRPAPARRLPPDQSSLHTVELPGRTLKFQATAGSIPINNTDGRLAAEIGYVAYRLDGADPEKRAVTFAFNGGPGSASAWVHIGGFGPWRLPMDQASLAPSVRPALVANAETWLDFTDLVFIDPVGTGFSRLARAASSESGSESGARRFYSVQGDADSVAEFIAKWLRQAGRLASPKMIVGESYGGIRAPKVLSALQAGYGVGMNAMLLVSPVIDFGLFRGPRHHVRPFVNILPTIAATARELKGEPAATRADLAEAEAYARGEYLADLLKGPRDVTAQDRLAKRVAALSGLAEPVVRRYGARLDEFIFLRETHRPNGKRASGYDATVTGDDPDPSAYHASWDDPFSGALAAPMTAAMIDLYAKLGWKTELSYNLLSSEANRGWNWPSSTAPVESFTQIRAALALDPHLRVLVTHGFTDLRTPYFGNVLVLEQLPALAEGRVALQVYPGGHMHYSREASRRALREDARRLLEAAVAADPSRR
jgi:carboxypeptidase C (cathepsin A)